MNTIHTNSTPRVAILPSHVAALALLATTLGGCEGDNIREPMLRLCSNADCISAATAEDPCAPLVAAEPGTGIYAIHTLHEKASLAEDAMGTLTLVTACGDLSTHDLDYDSALENDKRTAIVPVVVPEQAPCGFLVQAKLFGHTSTCVRPITGDAATCAAVLAACPKDEEGDSTTGAEGEGDDGTTTGMQGGETTMGEPPPGMTMRPMAMTDTGTPPPDTTTGG